MEERESPKEHARRHGRRPVKKHPKPPMRPVNSLNDVIRQELWYVDTMVASPFRSARRQLKASRGSLAEGLDEALWALEGMTRLPIKVMQAAFGERLGPPAAEPQEAQHAPEHPDRDPGGS